MNGQIFDRTQRVFTAIPNQRGAITENFIIAVNRRDPDGNAYTDLARRAQDAFNLYVGRNINDPVELTEIDERELPPRERLEPALTRHDGVIFRVRND